MLENVSRIAPMLAVAVCVAACGGSGSSSGTSAAAPSTAVASATTTSPQAIGFEGVPIEQGADLAPPGTTGTATVDGISCRPTEQLAYHIHAHLTVYVNGAPRALPGGIGIPGSKVVNDPQYGPVALGGRCIYWLHTHAPDGIIHVESPIVRLYTLGEFFDEWRQPLSSTDVAGARGRVMALVDGKPWTASPRAIPLLPHAVIQLDVGSPTVPFQPMSWAGVQL
jgi:hypothetical protein